MENASMMTPGQTTQSRSGCSQQSRRKTHGSTLQFTLVAIILILLAMLPSASALVSTSQLGFHPQGIKTFVVYTTATTGNFSIVRSDGMIVKNGTLTQPTNHNGTATVLCQGGATCLVGDFTDIRIPNTYKITTSLGENSSNFSISSNIYRDNAPVFNEFFDALSLQDSSYHADINSFSDPTLTSMADGSFIMTADQAALTLIRLGSAYRRNPTALSSDTRVFVRSNTPDIVEHMIRYTEYLESLQDTHIQTRYDGVGFRLNTGMGITGAFVPGATSMSTLSVYDSSPAHALIGTPAVTSLCGALHGAAYNACINDAELLYKCQADEPCITLEYNEATGTRLPDKKQGYGVARGWTYEFGCFFDVDLQNGSFNDKNNPCMVYDMTESRAAATMTLLAYVEAIPGIEQYDHAKAIEMLNRAILTQQYIKNNYTAFTSGDTDAGFYGAASFILYDITQNQTFLDDAYNVRNTVNQVPVSDSTRDNEFYWEEYVRHKAIITTTKPEYNVSGTDPSEFFRGKMYHDYKDRGALSIANNGERIFQFDPNILFQNSRFMLTEGLLAAKTTELSSDNAAFIQSIADEQLAWLTGKNGVHNGTALDSPIASFSFIFGIGRYPTQFHSRLLMNTGYSAASNGDVIGMRGTGLMFYNGTEYMYLDGKTIILNSTLGAIGNGYNGENQTPEFNGSQVFKNGKTYIPGWINGAFIAQIPGRNDSIYNYRDNRQTYEFTESTNEIVATAIELFAYRDAQYNNVTMLATPELNATIDTSAALDIATTPWGADVFIDGVYVASTPPTGYMHANITQGTHALLITKTNYTNYTETIDATAGTSTTRNITLNLTIIPCEGSGCNGTNSTNASLFISSSPAGANITIDGTPRGTTPLTTSITPGTHNITLQKEGYRTTNDTINATTGTNITKNYLLNENTTPILLLSTTNATLVNGTLTTYETLTTTYTVQFDNNATISWYLDGNSTPLQISQSNRATFVWTPDILYTSDGKTANITASGNEITNATFNVNVINYINPFWQDTIGEPDAILHVFTNNNVRNFTNVTVELEDANGKRNITLDYQYLTPTETDWKAQLTDMAEGNTFMRKVIVEDNKTTFSTTFDVMGLRAHYHQISPANATLFITSTPTAANITIDGSLSGTTPLTASLTPGIHEISVQKEGYITISEMINATTGMNITKNYSLFENTTPILLSNSTNATTKNDTLSTYEAETTAYHVAYDKNTSITWYVNGVPQRTTQSDADTFNWTPDILYTSNNRDANITASGNNVTYMTFNVNVINYINPFWQDTMGQPDAILHIFTNNEARNFTNITAELTDRTGTHIVNMNEQFINPLTQETDWKVQLTNMAEGNTVLARITVTDNITNYTETFSVNTLLAHYRQETSHGSSGGSGGGGGGGAYTAPSNGSNGTAPEIIYVIFNKDTVKEGEAVELKADVKSDIDITTVQAVLINDAGLKDTAQLSLTSGTGGYGTWTAVLSKYRGGNHELKEMVVTDKKGKKTIIPIGDRAFYVIGKTVTQTERLALIYAMLVNNTIKPGTAVTIRLDVRDFIGVKSVTAVLKGRDADGKEVDMKTVTLHRVTGSPQYGTWEGEVTLDRSDTTYLLQSVTMDNGNETRETKVYNQRVYVEYVKNDPSPLTGMVVGDNVISNEDITKVMRNPMTPLFIGLFGMGIAMFIAAQITYRAPKVKN